MTNRNPKAVHQMWDLALIQRELCTSMISYSATKQTNKQKKSVLLVFAASPAGDWAVSGCMEAGHHRHGILTWLPRRCARRHQRRPDWNPTAAMGGKAWRANWHQEAPPAVRKPQEGHVGELHLAQVGNSIKTDVGLFFQCQVIWCKI